MKLGLTRFGDLSLLPLLLLLTLPESLLGQGELSKTEGGGAKEEQAFVVVLGGYEQEVIWALCAEPEAADGKPLCYSPFPDIWPDAKDKELQAIKRADSWRQWSKGVKARNGDFRDLAVYTLPLYNSAKEADGLFAVQVEILAADRPVVSGGEGLYDKASLHAIEERQTAILKAGAESAGFVHALRLIAGTLGSSEGHRYPNLELWLPVLLITLVLALMALAVRLLSANRCLRSETVLVDQIFLKVGISTVGSMNRLEAFSSALDKIIENASGRKSGSSAKCVKCSELSEKLNAIEGVMEEAVGLGPESGSLVSRVSAVVCFRKVAIAELKKWSAGEGGEVLNICESLKSLVPEDQRADWVAYLKEIQASGVRNREGRLDIERAVSQYLLVGERSENLAESGSSCLDPRRTEDEFCWVAKLLDSERSGSGRLLRLRLLIELEEIQEFRYEEAIDVALDLCAIFERARAFLLSLGPGMNLHSQIAMAFSGQWLHALFRAELVTMKFYDGPGSSRFRPVRRLAAAFRHALYGMGCEVHPVALLAAPKGVHIIKQDVTSSLTKIVRIKEKVGQVSESLNGKAAEAGFVVDVERFAVSNMGSLEMSHLILYNPSDWI